MNNKEQHGSLKQQVKMPPVQHRFVTGLVFLSVEITAAQ